MNKFITDELITQRMESKGWIEGCDDEHAKKQVLEHFECEITDQWQNPDFSIYEESTADGYSVWIATNDDKHINVNEDVYYYENELHDVLYDAIPDYNNIYCDNYDFVEDAITRHYEDLLSRIEEEVVDELHDEGYSDKIVTPINALQYIEMISQDDQFTGAKEIYDGFINITVDHEYKWLNNATQVIKDRNRYEIIANHYGLTIERAVKGELIFKALKNEN
tara:strand:+ start:421 stop:1086 length:666 start_codon:yes stop_codon:yes gene_type:complete